MRKMIFNKKTSPSEVENTLRLGMFLRLFSYCVLCPFPSKKSPNYRTTGSQTVISEGPLLAHA